MRQNEQEGETDGHEDSDFWQQSMEQMSKRDRMMDMWIQIFGNKEWKKIKERKVVMDMNVYIHRCLLVFKPLGCWERGLHQDFLFQNELYLQMQAI